MFNKYLIPDYYLDDIYMIRPEFLIGKGISAIVADIDNTLVTYDDPEPTPSLLVWLKKMEQAGIKIALVSNNSKHDRVITFNKNLGYHATARSGKPFGKGVKKALFALGVSPKEAVMLGDQIFTDILAGSRLGMTTILVKPIKDRTDLFFRTKRKLEKPYLKKYARRHASDKEETK